MGIFDFFRKKPKIEEKEKEEVVIEKIAISEVDKWLQNKIDQNGAKEKEVMDLIKSKINDLVKELEDKIVILEDFDISKRKEEERVKNIVYASRDKYIESVGSLIEKLSRLNEYRLEEFVKKIDKYFNDFNKESYKNFERARYLIGKEIVSINDSLKNFSKEILEAYNENKHIDESYKAYMLIKEKLEYLSLIDKELDELIGKKLELDNKLISKENEHTDLSKKLEEVKVSEAYLGNLKYFENLELLKEETKKDIFELKQLIDFKELASFFHINPEQLKTVNNLRENFYNHFIEDNGKAITDFLDEAKLNNEKIAEAINNVNSKLDDIKNKEKEIKKDETLELMEKIKQAESNVLTIKFEKSKEDKREDKLKEKKEETINFLKKELSKFNVEILV